MVNNNINDEIDADALGASSVSGATIKNTDIEFTTSRSNNDINNELDISILGVLDMAIKDMDIEPIASGTNNNTDVEVDANKFINRAISKIDIEFTVVGLHKFDIIVKKRGM